MQDSNGQFADFLDRLRGQRTRLRGGGFGENEFWAIVDTPDIQGCLRQYLQQPGAHHPAVVIVEIPDLALRKHADWLGILLLAALGDPAPTRPRAIFDRWRHIQAQVRQLQTEMLILTHGERLALAPRSRRRPDDELYTLTGRWKQQVIIAPVVLIGDVTMAPLFRHDPWVGSRWGWYNLRSSVVTSPKD